MNNTIRVAIVGARGHVGFELIGLIDQHPIAELTVAYSRSYSGQLVAEKVDGFSNKSLIYSKDYAEDLLVQDVDVIFVALPNGVAAANKSLWQQLSQSACIIDLSADFRFDADWQYGQPESHQQSLIGHRLIANPGCYATAMQLGILPMVDELDGIVQTFGISGYSGAGSTPSDKNNPKKLAENIMAYQLVDHIHEREVSHVLSCDVRLTPHVADFFRGIHLTLSVGLCEEMSVSEVVRKYQQFYQNHDLIKVFNEVPEVQSVRGKHEVHIGGFRIKDQQLVLCVVIDNLLKGAATQALQNMNLALSLQYPLSINTGLTLNNGVSS